MKPINLYLALNCQMLSAGIENLIKNQFNEVNVQNIDSETVLFNSIEEPQKDRVHLIICDTSICQNFKLKINRILDQYPFFKVVIILEEFDFAEVQFLYGIGVTAVLHRNINKEEFLNMVLNAVDNKKSICETFKDRVVDKFCKTRPIRNANGAGISVEIREPEISVHYKHLYDLTEREGEILTLISKGYNNKDIARELFISTHTVGTHRRNILSKLNVKNSAEMVRVALTNNLLTA